MAAAGGPLSARGVEPLPAYFNLPFLKVGHTLLWLLEVSEVCESGISVYNGEEDSRWLVTIVITASFLSHKSNIFIECLQILKLCLLCDINACHGLRTDETSLTSLSSDWAKKGSK